jgi:uncharacterized protein YbjT (DUF2867 family)
MTPQLTELVVGATGSIGRLVAGEALRRGHAVRAPVRDRGRARQLPPDEELVEGDLALQLHSSDQMRFPG